jgi:bifunctional enzyme CysN/CysC
MNAIPVSALLGDNVVLRSHNMGWWDGPPLLAYLESLDVADEAASRPLRFPVQLVLRTSEGRRYAGTIASGRLAAEETVAVAPSGRRVRVESIVGCDGQVQDARAGDAITLTLAEEADLARGDVLSSPDRQPSTSSGFAARIVWFAPEPLLPGRSYLVRIGTAMVPGAVTGIRHRIEPGTLRPVGADTLDRNDIALCHISLVGQVAFDRFEDDPKLGAFILIDRADNRTVGAGVILHDLRRATNVQPQAITISPEARAAHKGHRPAVLWLTGLSGSGKSTIANLVEERLWALGCHTMLLDGDNVRRGLNNDLGFSEADRVENIRRVGEMAKLMIDAGLIVICSFISPYRSERRLARELIGGAEFLELFVDTPLSECISRDPKGLYAKAVAGRIPNFTGISAPYELPEHADLRLETLQHGPEDLADVVIDELRKRKIIPGLDRS